MESDRNIPMSRQIGKVQTVGGASGGEGLTGAGAGACAEFIDGAPLPRSPLPPASSSRLARRAPRRSARESGPRTGRQPSLLSLCY